LADGFSWSVVGAREVAPRAERYFVYAWIVASLLVSAYVVSGHWKVSRRRRTWRETALNGVRVLISKDVGPAVVGLINPAIVLPEWVLDLTPEKRRLILSHEEEHTRAGDAVVLALASLCVALMPWNAPLWWTVRRLRHAVEIDCDGRVLRGTPDRVAYGELLLDVGERASLRWSGVAAFGDSSSFLAGRIRNIIAPPPRAWRLVAGAGACAMGLLLVAACEVPQTTLGSAEPAAGSQEAEARIAPSKVSGGDAATVAPSPALGVEPERQSTATTSLTLVRGGRPNPEDLWALVRHLRPEMIGEGLDAGQALWVAVDAGGRIRKTWVGPAMIFEVGNEPQPFLLLPEDNPERIAYEAHLREKAAMLQQNVPDLQIRSEITLGFGSTLPPDRSGLLRFVTEIPGEPQHDGVDGVYLVQDLTVHIEEAFAY
jgi:hypothetical protein